MTFPKRYAIYLADLNPTVGGEIRKVRPRRGGQPEGDESVFGHGRRLSSHLRPASSVAWTATDTLRGLDLARRDMIHPRILSTPPDGHDPPSEINTNSGCPGRECSVSCLPAHDRSVPPHRNLRATSSARPKCRTRRAARSARSHPSPPPRLEACRHSYTGSDPGGLACPPIPC